MPSRLFTNLLPAPRVAAAWLSTCLLALPLAANAQQPDDSDLPVAEIQAFAEVFERIKRAYVDEVDDATLLQNAMRGMLNELDPHSAYLDADAFRDMQESARGEFGGVGVEIGKRDGQLMVITPLDDTPAARAGIMARDAILRVDDTPTEGLSLQEALEVMRGDIGTQLELTILRDGESAPRNITLTRETISTRSVKHDLLSPGYGYLRISQFQSNTGEQVNEALATLAATGELKGLVLDLRNNPGGVLQAAVDVSDSFLESGLVVYTKGRLPGIDQRFSATATTAAPDIPLVVLINDGSASAAEIVAGAIQDQRRGVVMGTKSFGKGSVQQLIPLGENEGLKLTTALYYTPNGRSIQARGITPDVEVVRGRLEVSENASQRLREADLDGHLKGNNDVPEYNILSTRLENDYQLGEALNLLKALDVLGERAPNRP
ncbi:S41 family peptidase [Halomonas halocynthiae]|uniref:S41 family peptidase n=1 Tax=Halomonas halocynthiae TaxID=176290 RepID=UPI0004113A49|nr:S41 family peptidase [Halomonas halocynthiae]